MTKLASEDGVGQDFEEKTTKPFESFQPIALANQMDH